MYKAHRPSRRLISASICSVSVADWIRVVRVIVVVHLDLWLIDWSYGSVAGLINAYSALLGLWLVREYLEFYRGVIGSPDVGIPGPSGADSRHLVSWSWLWACPARCKRSPPVRLGRNAWRVRFQRAWLTRRNSRARRSLARAWGIQESSEPISFLAETGRSETLNQTNDLACKRPGLREPGAGLAA
jgi:hypothetical protein